MTEHNLRVAGHMAAEVAAVVVAAGRGLRAGGDPPKQYRELLGEPVIRPSLAALAEHSGISLVQPVIHPDDAALFRAASADASHIPILVGDVRWATSTRKASCELSGGSQFVFWPTRSSK